MKLRPIDPSRARTCKINTLARKVRRSQFVAPLKPGASIGEFIAALPAALAANDLRELARAIATARRAGRTVLLIDRKSVV